MFYFTQFPGPEKLRLSSRPQRIVSLVPSVTEALLEFGIVPVGRTSFCIEPAQEVASIARVGGTKTPNIKRIQNLDPDLVIANFEENTQKDVEAMQEKGLHVWITYPEKVEDTKKLLEELLQLSDNPALHVSKVEAYAQFLTQPYPKVPIDVLVLIWKKPWMAVGPQTYPHHVLEFAGGNNACQVARYPVLQEDQIVQMCPDLLVLPTEPYAFDIEDVAFWQQRLGSTTVVQFSGEDLFWSGPRAIKACEELAKLFSEVDGRESKVSL